ncbi:MAG TPA: peptidase E [Longimicrobium sp.]|jgi:peptidase E|uniref:Type 1 glutamine amidotransferase-like domain-containing protein n=1 Tax=Longimicrobium sp. TaxID=2029185 RepID=UPI002ED895D3
MPLITRGQIVAFGGGGFAMEPDNPLLDDYALSLCRRSRPRVCLIPTASGDAQPWVDRFYDSFDDGRCEPSHLTLFHRTVTDLHAFLCDQDLLYVAGGNTVNLLAVWRAQGLAEVLPDVLARGTVACGVSAGGLCWFERGITDSYGPGLNPLTDGLGFLPGSFCPHFDSESKRLESFRGFVRDTGLPGIGADDGVGLHYRDGQLVRVVSSRPDARAWRLEPAEGEVEMREVGTEYLGNAGGG